MPLVHSTKNVKTIDLTVGQRLPPNLWTVITRYIFYVLLCVSGSYEYDNSQDEVNVFVVRLAGLRIHAPLRRLKVGNTMPLFAVGITSEAETPHAFGSANPALTFAWTINSQQVTTGPLIRTFWWVWYGRCLIPLETGIDWIPDF